MSKRIGIVILFLFTMALTLAWVRKLNDARRFAMIIDRVAIVSTVLRQHVENKGAFPPSLDTLADEGKVDHRLIEPMAGERIEYILPDKLSRASTPVIVVTFHSKRLIVSKDFKDKIEMNYADRR